MAGAEPRHVGEILDRDLFAEIAVDELCDPGNLPRCQAATRGFGRRPIMPYQKIVFAAQQRRGFLNVAVRFVSVVPQRLARLMQKLDDRTLGLGLPRRRAVSGEDRSRCRVVERNIAAGQQFGGHGKPPWLFLRTRYSIALSRSRLIPHLWAWT